MVPTLSEVQKHQSTHYRNFKEGSSLVAKKKYGNLSKLAAQTKNVSPYVFLQMELYGTPATKIDLTWASRIGMASN